MALSTTLALFLIAALLEGLRELKFDTIVSILGVIREILSWIVFALCCMELTLGLVVFVFAVRKKFQILRLRAREKC